MTFANNGVLVVLGHSIQYLVMHCLWLFQITDAHLMDLDVERLLLMHFGCSE